MNDTESVGTRKTILVSGFEPFGGLSSNPAGEVLSLLPPEIGGCAVECVAVPVEYDRCVDVLMEAAEKTSASAVVLLGQARGRANVTVERVAVNAQDCANADNAGVVRGGSAICVDGPDAYFSTLPIYAMVEASRGAGIPAAVSDTAGTYVCNTLMYGVLHRLAELGRGVPAGFVHVPLAHGQAIELGCPNEPSMSMGDIAHGVTAMLEVVARRI